MAAAAEIEAAAVEIGEAAAVPASAVVVEPVWAAGALASVGKLAAERASVAAKVAEHVSAAERGVAVMPAHGSRHLGRHSLERRSLGPHSLERRSQRRAWLNPPSRAATIALGLA